MVELSDDPDGTALVVPASFIGLFGSLRLCCWLWYFGSWKFYPSHPLENIRSPSMCSSMHPLSAVSLWISGPYLLYRQWLQVGGKFCESHARLPCWSCPIALQSCFKLPRRWIHIGRRIWCTVVSPLGLYWVSRLAACIHLDCGWEAEPFVALSGVWGIGMSLFPRKNRIGSIPTPFSDPRERIDGVGRLAVSLWHIPISI